MHIAIVVGNPKPNSRTLNIARQVAREICDRLDGRIALEIDLALHTGSIFTWPNAEMAELNPAVARSDILVIASPTYRATYTVLLKAFLDRYPSNGLVGVTAVPVMTGASDLHSMARFSSLQQPFLGRHALPRSLWLHGGELGGSLCRRSLDSSSFPSSLSLLGRSHSGGAACCLCCPIRLALLCAFGDLRLLHSFAPPCHLSHAAGS